MENKENFQKSPSVLSVTNAAVLQLRRLIQSHEPHAVGIRLGVKEGGCNGLSYAMDFAKVLKNKGGPLAQLAKQLTLNQ